MQPNAGVDFLIPPLNPRSSSSNARRYSAAVVNYGVNYQSAHGNTLNPGGSGESGGQPAYNIFQTLGSGMVKKLTFFSCQPFMMKLIQIFCYVNSNNFSTNRNINSSVKNQMMIWQIKFAKVKDNETTFESDYTRKNVFQNKTL